MILAIGKAGLRLDTRDRSFLLSIGWCTSTNDTYQVSSAGERARVQGLFLSLDLVSGL